MGANFTLKWVWLIALKIAMILRRVKDKYTAGNVENKLSKLHLSFKVTDYIFGWVNPPSDSNRFGRNTLNSPHSNEKICIKACSLVFASSIVVLIFKFITELRRSLIPPSSARQTTAISPPRCCLVTTFTRRRLLISSASGGSLLP